MDVWLKRSLYVSFILPNAVHAEKWGLLATRDRMELSSQLPFKAPFLSSFVHNESDAIVRGTGAFN